MLTVCNSELAWSNEYRCIRIFSIKNINRDLKYTENLKMYGKVFMH